MMFCWPVLVTANAPMFIPSKYLDKLNNGDDLDEQIVEDRFICKFFISDTCITTIWIVMKIADFICLIAADMANISRQKTYFVGAQYRSYKLCIVSISRKSRTAITIKILVMVQKVKPKL